MFVGLLLDTHSGRMVALAGRSLVGRGPACTVTLSDPRASAEHATLSWSGAGWALRDLGSRNGTWCDGRRLEAGARVAIARDAALGFGAPEPAWILADDRGVGPSARANGGETVYGAPGLLALPSPEEPRATVLWSAVAERWLVELRGDTRVIADGEILELDGSRWTVALPAPTVPDTVDAPGAPALATSSLRFSPSRDEEHVDVVVMSGDGAALPVPARSGHYMLLTLARARLADAGGGIAAAEQGWRYADEVADMLRWSAERLNLEIFRARSLLAKLGVRDASTLIERRAGSGQLRIGVQRLVVERTPA